MLIAHRGASGYLPENTLPAFALAHAMGADALELDVVLSRDGVPVAFHDLWLEATTNAPLLFPERAREDGHLYVLDFEVEELKRLAVRERYPNRFRQDSRGFQIPTLEEVLQLVHELNRSSQRQVDVYVELKSSGFHRSRGFDLEAACLEVVGRNTSGEGTPGVRIVAEEPACLRRLRFELAPHLPRVQLVTPEIPFTLALITPAGLDSVTEYADAVAPEKHLVERSVGGTGRESTLVREAQARGLAVLPYTFRADEPTALPSVFEEEIERFAFGYGVDGLFTDYPDRARRALAAGQRPPRAA